MALDNRAPVSPVESPHANYGPPAVASNAIEATRDLIIACPTGKKAKSIREYIRITGADESLTLEEIAKQMGPDTVPQFLRLCSDYDDTEQFISYASRPGVEVTEHKLPVYTAPEQLHAAEDRLPVIAGHRVTLGLIIRASLHTQANGSTDARRLIERLYQRDGRPSYGTVQDVQDKLREILEKPWQSPDTSYLVPRELPMEESDRIGAETLTDKPSRRPGNTSFDGEGSVDPPADSGETPGLLNTLRMVLYSYVLSHLPHFHTPHPNRRKQRR